MASGTIHAAATKQMKAAVRVADNERAVAVFVTTIGTLMAFIVGGHIARNLYNATYADNRRPGAVVSTLRYADTRRGPSNECREVRRLLLHKIVLFPTLGHGFVHALYLGINVVCLFGFLNNDNMPFLVNVAARAAW